MTPEREDLILRAALYCVKDMMFRNNGVEGAIYFNKEEDGIDGYVDLATVSNYLSDKLYDLRLVR